LLTGELAMEARELYLCKECNQRLPPSAFSKSQVNKLQHKKIDSAKCVKCTPESVRQLDAPTKASKEAKKAQQQQQQQLEQGKQGKKSADPSSLYIKNPTGTPIVLDAIAFAAARGLEYKVYLKQRAPTVLLSFNVFLLLYYCILILFSYCITVF
jgi:hypothetical protein